MSTSQRLKLNANSPSEDTESGIQNERLLLLLFECIKWDVHVLCLTASLNRKLRAFAKRLLWKELCLYRAPKMIAALTEGGSTSRLGGGWPALAKLLFHCCGCTESTRHFKVSQATPGHFLNTSRFSKTSGRSFLAKRCSSDLLYVSDPCEHSVGDKEDILGIYRGVFRGFMKSKTRACLISRGIGLEEGIRCPYCGARVWSMTSARLVPKSAARRLGSHEGGIEYFVCVNGHLYGMCWLVPLSSDENDDDDGSNGDDDGEASASNRVDDRTADNGSCSFIANE